MEESETKFHGRTATLLLLTVCLTTLTLVLYVHHVLYSQQILSILFCCSIVRFVFAFTQLMKTRCNS